MKKMRYFTLLYFTLYIVFIKSLRNVNGDSFNKNVGTTLFTEADVVKTCWARDEVALLTSRKIFQDLLPGENYMDITNDLYIQNTVEYFKIILESVKNTTYGKSRHIILLALADTLGGYMYNFLLPLTRHSYYCGYLSYDSVQKLYNLFNELKMFLKTNGVGWIYPTQSFQKSRVLPLVPYKFPDKVNQKKSCDNIIYYEDVKNSKDVIVPMPYFDTGVTPVAIALPFKRFALRNVESKDAAYVLVKYYVAVIRCLEYKSKSQETISTFHRQFKRFLRKEVLRRLDDNKFYAAFGGVHRLMLNLNDGGVGSNLKSGMKEHVDFGSKVVVDDKEFEQVVQTCQGCEKNKNNHLLRGADGTSFIMVTLLIALIIWIIIGTSYFCFRVFCKSRPSNTCLRDNSLYQNLRPNGRNTWSSNSSTPVFTRPERPERKERQEPQKTMREIQSSSTNSNFDRTRSGGNVANRNARYSTIETSSSQSTRGSYKRAVPRPLPRSNENTTRKRGNDLPIKYNFQYDLEDSTTSLDSSPSSPVPTPRPRTRAFLAGKIQ